MIQESNLLDIVKTNVLIYYYLTRNKKNKRFSLIINEIYDIFIKSFEVLLLIKRDNRISVNDLYLCGFEIKYKRCCESYTFKDFKLITLRF